MKYLHIGPDSQFVQFIAPIFEKHSPSSNEFLLTNVKTDIPAYPLGIESTSLVRTGIAGWIQVAYQSRYCHAIVVHSLGVHGIIALLLSKSTTVRVWSGWGSDYYGTVNDAREELLGFRTIGILENLSTRSKFNLAAWKKFLLNKFKRIAVKRVDIFSAPVKSDLYVLKERFPNFSGKYFQINYGNVSSTFYSNNDTKIGNNILIGNSSSATCNHADAFDILKKFDLKGRKIITPLTYGDIPYGDEIIRYGKECFGDDFLPITKHLPLSEYLSVISSCGVVIMNHQRQQALGNIGAALYRGARVFLNESNPLYHFFKDNGAIIFSVNNILSQGIPEAELSESEVKQNRNFLQKFWGDEVVDQNIHRLINEIQFRLRANQ